MNQRTVHLLATPCSFDWSFSCKLFDLQQVAGGIGDTDHYTQPGPFERHFYSLALGSQPTDQPGVFRWEFDVGDAVALISLWFGKAVDDLGPIWSGLGFALPGLMSVRPNQYFRLSAFGGSRESGTVRELDWRSLERLRGVLDSLDEPPDSLRVLVSVSNDTRN